MTENGPRSVSGRESDVRKMLTLDGRVAVVVGASARLGQAICESLAESGALVVATSRSPERAETVCSSLAARGLKAQAEMLDVTCRHSVEAALERVLGGQGQVDVLVNAAVARYPYTPVEALSWDDWALDLSVNVFGVYACSVVFGQAMIERRGGSIINIGSIYGVGGVDHRIYPDPAMSTGIRYAASKGAVLQLTRYLAAMWGDRGVRVNCLSLGGVLAEQPAVFREAYGRRTPMGRMAYAEEVKGAVLYLASDASSYVTGHNLVVDGGWTAW